MPKRQEEYRASDSTQRRKAEARYPVIGRLIGQHYGHWPGNRITIGHRDHCEPAWRTRRDSRGRLGQTAAHGGAGPTHETRASGIRQDSTLYISLKISDIPTPGSLRTSDARHRTARHRRRRAGRSSAHSGTAPTQEARAPDTSQNNTVDSPCKMDDRTGQSGQEKDLFRDIPFQESSGERTTQRNTTVHMLALYLRVLVLY